MAGVDAAHRAPARVEDGPWNLRPPGPTAGLLSCPRPTIKINYAGSAGITRQRSGSVKDRG
jgi:hypothetical protein